VPGKPALGRQWRITADFQETGTVAVNPSRSHLASSAWRFDMGFILDRCPSRNSGSISRRLEPAAQRWAASPFHSRFDGGY
jgi:hypothetical protein